MVRDCAAELLGYHVAFVSLWPGPVRTELVTSLLDEIKKKEELTSENRKVGSWGQNGALVGKRRIEDYMQKQKTVNASAESRK